MFGSRDSGARGSFPTTERARIIKHGFGSSSVVQKANNAQKEHAILRTTCAGSNPWGGSREVFSNLNLPFELAHATRTGAERRPKTIPRASFYYHLIIIYSDVSVRSGVTAHRRRRRHRIKAGATAEDRNDDTSELRLTVFLFFGPSADNKGPTGDPQTRSRPPRTFVPALCVSKKNVMGSDGSGTKTPGAIKGFRTPGRNAFFPGDR